MNGARLFRRKAALIVYRAGSPKYEVFMKANRQIFKLVSPSGSAGPRARSGTRALPSDDGDAEYGRSGWKPGARIPMLNNHLVTDRRPALDAVVLEDDDG